MAERVVAAGVAVVVLTLSTFVAPARAATQQAMVGTDYFQDVRTGSQEQIVVTKGDRVTFTFVETVLPPHTVHVDELNVHSGDGFQGQTFTTPVLDKIGDFALYCAAHRERGHVARLVVQAVAVKTPTPTHQPTAAPPDGDNGDDDYFSVDDVPLTATAIPVPSLPPIVLPGTPAPRVADPAGPQALARARASSEDTQPWWLRALAIAVAAGAGAAAAWELRRTQV